MFNKNKKEKNFLLYIPVKNHTNFEERGKNIFLIFNHDRFVEKIARKIFKKPPVTDIELDDMGSDVWKFIDGKNNISDIIEKLREKYGEKCEPISERLILYIRYLNRRNWIKFKIIK